MTGEIELISKRVLSSVLGVTASGLAGLQGINRVPNNVALYGDSLIAASVFSQTQQKRRSATSDINIANNLCGQRMRFVCRRAVSGIRSDQILQLFLADIADDSLLASGAGTVIFNGGTNDIAQAVTGFTDVVSGTAVTLANVAANTVTNAARIIDICTALGIQCIFRTVHGATGLSSAQIAALEDLNRMIRRLPLGRRMWLLETRDVFRNPLTTTASAIAFRSGMLYDNTHPGVGGAYALGKVLANIVRAAIPPLPSSYSDASNVYSADLTSNLLDNAVFSGTSGTLGAGGTLGTNPAGGALAGIPTTYTASRLTGDSTTTFTVNVGEDAEGRYVEIVATASVAEGGVRLQCAPSSPATKLSPGDIVQGFSTIEVISGAVNLSSACPYFDFNATVGGATNTESTTGALSIAGRGSYPTTEGFVFEEATEALLVPAYSAMNFFTLRPLQMTFVAAGSATVRVRKPRFEKVAGVPAILA